MSGHLNALQHASSAYLRSAMHQPVDWNEFAEEAFARAKRENKPILLDIGAVWCHWCHVMDRESYEDRDIAQLINERFIAVKVDRDERPDVDGRYQAAVQAISGQGGWPLTVFLMPDGRPFFGGTYFPPEDRYGRVGFKRVLMTLADAYRDRPADIEESAQGVMSAISASESFEGRAGTLSPRIVESIVQSAVKQFDPVHGGFGTQPKFPHPSVMDLLLHQYARTRSDELRRICELTMVRMAQGGVYDQLGGGFHRYSVDDKWIVPHFEKMSYDNSELLKNYAHAYQVFGEEYYADVVRDIVRWMDESLSDRERGGFYASQDADIDLDDDGDYFTWTLDEARSVLDAPQAEIAAAYFDIAPVGEMHHDPKKNVLFVAASLDEMSTRFAMSAQQIATEIARIKRKMLDARNKRPTPFIDKTVYVGWNALCISAYFAAARALADNVIQQFALHSLDRIWRDAWSEDALAHVIAYSDGRTPAKPIDGVLDDYAHLANALLDAFEATGSPEYFHHAQRLCDRMIVLFHDERNGGFFDTRQDAHPETRLGALSAPRKPLQDTPTPAGNPSAAAALLRLHSYTGDAHLRHIAEKTLATFAGIVEHFGYFAASYGLALTHLVGEHQRVLILNGSDSSSKDAAEQLAREANRFWRADASVVRIDSAADPNSYPSAIRELLPALLQVAQTRALAVVCSGNACGKPAFTAAELQQELTRLSSAAE